MFTSRVTNESIQYPQAPAAFICVYVPSLSGLSTGRALIHKDGVLLLVLGGIGMLGIQC